MSAVQPECLLISSLYHLKRTVIFTASPKAASLPEIGDCNKELVRDFLLHREHEVEVPQGLGSVLNRHSSSRFCHSQVNIIHKRHSISVRLAKPGNGGCQYSAVIESNIHPLR